MDGRPNRRNKAAFSNFSGVLYPDHCQNTVLKCRDSLLFPSVLLLCLVIKFFLAKRQQLLKGPKQVPFISERFSTKWRKTKTNYNSSQSQRTQKSIGPIKLKTNVRSRREARENLFERTTCSIGFGFTF